MVVRRHTRHKWLVGALTLLAVTVVVLLVGICIIGPEKIGWKLQSVLGAKSLDRSDGATQFPDIDERNLSPVQRAIVKHAKQEFALQPYGEKYSEGAHEAWCANFVSWVMKESGVPLKNPHSSSWRIPGTFTLYEYYKSTGQFRDAASGYVPQVGDVAIYRGSPIFGDHTNIVLQNKDGVVTTVGGNENGRIRVYVNTLKNYSGLLGYAKLQ